MIIPVDRENQFHKKMKSPMFYDRFKNDSWNIIFFDVLYKYWFKMRKKINIEELFNKQSTLKKEKNVKDNHQKILF